MIVAVTGPNGRLGSYLVRKIGYIPMECDITNPESIKDKLAELNPGVIVNCAAYTDVDGAETHYRKALDINQFGVAYLREAFEGWLIHLSTDYIFGGVQGPYSERFDVSEDFTKGRYGKSKSYGEINMFSVPDRLGTIVRTTMLYGSPYKPDDFVSHILEQLDAGKPFEVPYTLVGSPTYVPHLAEGIRYLIDHYWHNPPPILNIVGEDVLSRYDFALMIASVWGYDKNLIIPTNKHRGFAYRPRKAGLKVEMAKRLHIPIYSVLEGLEKMKHG